jgi:hypothetical protein
MYSREDNFQIDWGMGPDSLFCPASKNFIRRRLLIDWGIEPLKLLPPRYKCWSLYKSPNDAGISPTNLLWLISRTFNRRNLNISLGNWSLKLLLRRSNITRNDRFSRFGEMVPIRPVLLRIKLWTLLCLSSQVTPYQVHTEYEDDQLLANIW